LGGASIDDRYEEQMPDLMPLATGLPLGKETVAIVERAGKPTEPAHSAEPRHSRSISTYRNVL